jgi:PKD repeat protein
MKNVTSRLALALMFVLHFCTSNAQLANGSIAPDFTATDINGVSHNLYALLNAGKTVVIDFSATWCGPCWSYHQTHALKDTWNSYGPPGTNEMYVFYVECDGATTLADLNGTGGNTAGNWVTGTPYPILDNATIPNSYAVAYYPTVYVICPNKTVTLHDNPTKAQLYAARAACPAMATIANFSANNTAPCIGSTITLSDNTNGNPTSWSWSFSPNTVSFVGGTSATSQNPQVQFNGAGPYSVTLTAVGPYGTDNEVKTGFITPNTTVLNLPVVENFEGTTFPPVNWMVQNSDAPSIAWGTAGAKGIERRPAVGNTSSVAGCAGLNCFEYADTMKVDNLITSKINLVGAAAPKITFKRAYKHYSSTTSPTKFKDELKIFVSTDCGVTWGNPIYFKKGAALASNGTINTTFTPAVTADWATDVVDLTAYVGQTVNIKFEFGSRYGNNLYIDDINIANSAVAVASVSVASSVGNNTICAGTSMTFTATPVNGGTPTYQWKVNGSNVGTNSPTFTSSTLTNGQVVTCVMTSSIAGTTAATSNSTTVTVNAIPATPTVTANNPICSGSAINLTTATVANATYAWTGPNGYTSTSQNPTVANSTTAMNGTYNLIVTTNGCSSVAGTSTVSVTPSVTPANSVAITAGGNPTCVSQSVTFTATGINGGSTPSYQWKVNGTNVGTNSQTFTPTSIANGSIISCVLTSNAACFTSATATSNAITMTVTTSVTPALTIAASTTTICAGSNVTFTSAPANGGTAPTYQWKLNGNNVSSNSTYSSSSLATGDVVSCIMTSNSACASPLIATSNSISITVSPMVTPTVSISNNATNNTVCQGVPVVFSSVITNGGTLENYNWLVNGFSQGASTAQFQPISLSNNDIVSCVLTSNAACATSTTATSNATSMTVKPTPVFVSSSNSPVCSGTALNLSSTTLAGALYSWTGPNGFTSSDQNPTFANSTAAMSGSYALQITIDGCTATNSSSVVVNNTPATPVISSNGLVLTSSSPNGNQWIFNGVNISGANGTSYTTPANGLYTVTTTQDGCTSTSASFTQAAVSVEEINGGTNGIVIYPNPSKGIFNLKFAQKELANYTIEVRSVNGQIIDTYQLNNVEGKANYSINLENQSKGIYFVHITDGSTKTTQKIVIQ